MGKIESSKHLVAIINMASMTRVIHRMRSIPRAGEFIQAPNRLAYRVDRVIYPMDQTTEFSAALECTLMHEPEVV